MTAYGQADVESLVWKLVEAIEDESRLLAAGRMRLASISEALAAGDCPRLEELLEEADRESSLAAGLDRAPAIAIRRLADALDCSDAPPSLSRLIDCLPPWHRPAVAAARRHILNQARALRRQYRLTASLLRQCRRVNRALLDCLFPQSPAVATYDAAGPRQWRAGGGLINAER